MPAYLKNLSLTSEYYRKQILKSLKHPCCKAAVNIFAHKILGLLAMSKDDRCREVKEIKEKANKTFMETGKL